MNRREFLDALSGALADLPWREQERWLDFYGEMIDDRMEEGLTEAEAVAAVGSIEEIAAQILSQPQPAEQQQPPKKPKWEVKPWMILLLILGFPVWLPLLIAALVVFASVLIVLWSVLISFYAASVSVAAVAFAGIVVAFFFIPTGNGAGAAFCVGAGLICAGVAILLFLLSNLLAKGIAWLTKKLFKVRFSRKEAVQ